MSEGNDIKLPVMEELVISSSPHLHNNWSIKKIMYIVILALLPSCAMGFYYFGIDALLVLLVSVLSCVIVEFLWNKVSGKDTTILDGSAVITGLLLGMNLSAGVPLWICVLGGILAIVIGKMVYGGLGYNPFNPALVARVALLISFPKIMTTWMAVGSDITKTCATPLTNATSSLYESNLLDLFLGSTGGCLGETSAIALLLGGLILISFGLIKWQISVTFILTVAIFAFLDNLSWGIQDASTMALKHIFAGGLLLGAIFMATDMVTSPMTTLGCIVFGCGCGIITSVIRLFGGYPEGVSFSILFMNALVPLIDRYTRRKPFGKL